MAKAVDEDDRPVSVTKLLLTALLAGALGLLAFNLQHIVQVSHSHFNLHETHRTNAFCVFAKCKAEHIGDQDVSASVPPTEVVEPPLDLPQVHLPGTTTLLTDEGRAALMARVCGSPAVDGYSHVDPKCLDASPTAMWWKEYYRLGFRQQDLVAHIEEMADFDGLAVGWGIGNKMATVEDCAAACLAFKVGSNPGPFGALPCNTFTWCPDEICFEPDAHKHTKGDCWLKFTEGPASPELNYRGLLGPGYRVRHPTASDRVQWWGGVVLPPGMELTNGTFGPRYQW
ncbi:hypothetical protein FOA52_011674 [Chlamydomonas sp. UWO 241]|nr:hypothetical protein FOA52_011674 [Chlamydomonas sp. UWO 241]